MFIIFVYQFCHQSFPIRIPSMCWWWLAFKQDEKRIEENTTLIWSWPLHFDWLPEAEFGNSLGISSKQNLSPLISIMCSQISYIMVKSSQSTSELDWSIIQNTKWTKVFKLDNESEFNWDPKSQLTRFGIKGWIWRLLKGKDGQEYMLNLM